MDKLLTARLKSFTPNVYPNVAPLNYKLPCVVYQVIDTDVLTHLEGEAKESFVTMQLAVSSTVNGEAKSLAKSIRKDLTDWDDGKVQTVARINETAMVDSSEGNDIHRFLLFFKFYTTE